MIPEIAAHLPPSLATFGNRITLAADPRAGRPVASLRDRAVFDAVMAAFGAAYPEADRRSLVSLWSQSYLAALIIPCVTALLCLDRVLPVALEVTGFELAPDAALSRFVVPAEAPAGCRACPRFATLITDHFETFVDLCAGHDGLSPRVLWGNAGVMFDFTLRELAAAAALLPEPRAEAEALLGRRPCAGTACGPLARTFCAGGSLAPQRRRVCCMRYRLPGVPSCGALCPIRHPDTTPC
ncbi:siderophore-iron reductase FhuF [Methylobacterium sp. ID0610]|uniref:siderophore-iron reductase FhuF n=1 Tax=Methylobacterium carpenticola TaxID=3344827 RepID=UPI0036C15F75